MQFEFYVLNYNHNKKKIEMFNIFNNILVQEHTEKTIKKYLHSPKKFEYKPFCRDAETIYGFDALVKEIDGIIKWGEWSRYEYECSAGYVFETDCNKLEKIDCYMQAHANIENIVYTVLRQYKEQKREKEDQ